MYSEPRNGAHFVIFNNLWNKKIIFMDFTIKKLGIFKHKDYL